MVLHGERVVAGVVRAVTPRLRAVEIGVGRVVGAWTDGTQWTAIAEAIDESIEILGGGVAALLTDDAPTVFSVHRLRADHGVAT